MLSRKQLVSPFARTVAGTFFSRNSAERGVGLRAAQHGSTKSANPKKLLAQRMFRAALREPAGASMARSANVPQMLNARRGATIEIDCCSNATDSELDRV